MEDTKYLLLRQSSKFFKKLSLLSSLIVITNLLLIFIKEFIGNFEFLKKRNHNNFAIKDPVNVLQKTSSFLRQLYSKKTVASLQYNQNPYFINKSLDKIITCNLRKEYIQAIASGKKTYEGRINKESFKKYTPGKIVIWKNESDYVITKIVSRKVFLSFEKMLSKINFKLFIPEAENKEEAKKIYDSIPGYAENVKKYGALALGLKLKPKI